MATGQTQAIGIMVFPMGQTQAVFPTLALPQTVVVDAGATVGMIQFSYTNNYTINSPGALYIFIGAHF